MSAVPDILERIGFDEGIRGAFADLDASGEACLTGLACSAKAVALARLHRDSARPLLVVVPGQEEAEALLGDLEVCLGEERIFFFAETEVVPYDRRSPHVGLLGERIPTLVALSRAEPIVAVTTARAIAGRLPRPAEFERFLLPLRVGSAIPLEELREALLARGFRPERLVEEIGSFAVRGGLVDLYPFGSRNPVRVELFGDEIESIRTFDAATQRTVDELRTIDVLPQRELLLTSDVVTAARERGDLPFDEGADPFVEGIESWLPRFHPETATLLDYFGREGVVVLDEPSRLAEEADGQLAQARSQHDDLRARGHRVPDPDELFAGSAELGAGLSGRRTLRLALFAGESVRAAFRPEPLPEDVAPARRIRVTSQETFHGNFAVLRERLRATLDAGNAIYVLCDNHGQQSRLEEMLDDLAEAIRLDVAPLRNGFSLPDHALVVLTDHEMFARSARRY
ncbi:MAG: hypothetical protein ACRDGR_11230, partial [bacterium]